MYSTRITSKRLILFVFALFSPLGYALLRLVPRRVSRMASTPLVAGLCVSLLPVGLLYLNLAGIRLDERSVKVSFGALLLLWILWASRRPLAWHALRTLEENRRQGNQSFELIRVVSDSRRWVLPKHLSGRDAVYVTVLAFVLAASAIVRLLDMRGLVVPMWVDSVQHVEIARLIADRGGVPDSYLPFADVSPFSYHFGFHALVAFVHWLSGADIPETTLFVGQALNFAVVLSTYLLGARFVGSRLAGLVSAAVVGVFSTMPAYYTSWGRYTQLTGMVILPIAAALTLDAFGQQRTRGRFLYVGLSGLVVGGLIIAHPRVTVFYLCFLLAYVVVEMAVTRGERTAVIRTLAVGGGIGVVGMLSVAPWLWTVASSLLVRVWQGASATPAAANPFPFDYFANWVDQALIVLAAAGVVLAVARKNRVAITLALWTGLMLLSGNPYLAGLPGGNMVSNGAVAISLFLPISLLVGYVVASTADVLRARTWPLPVLVSISFLFVIASYFGASRLATVMNPSCILFVQQDQEAMQWIAENTPPDSTFLVNSRYWQFDIYVGTDGGYWIPALTGRKTTVPSVLYALGDAKEISRVNAVARKVSEADFAAGDVWSWLRRQGVDYVYIGYRGGPLTPAMFTGRSGFRVAYARDGVWIFKVVEQE